MYHDPQNLPSYPCQVPDLGRLVDGGALSSTRDAGVPVKGRLAPQVIQKVVRDHFGTFRACYEAGMGRNPNLHGRVTIQFVIARSGAVEEAHPICTSLPDNESVRCIADGFSRLSFPEPDGGSVTVVYPIMFNPGD